MKIKAKYRIKPEFGMSSMTDIVFLLLIFFMITASFTHSQGLRINLPTSQVAGPVLPTIHVAITEDLAYYIDNQNVSVTDLARILQEKLDTHENSTILLEADQSVPIAKVINVVSIAKSLNAAIAIAAKNTSKNQ